jgi:hypothetical protein
VSLTPTFAIPLRLLADQRDEALRRRAAGETLVEIAWSFNVSHMTIARLEQGDHSAGKPSAINMRDVAEA